jgi:hypothetical protein
MDLLLELEHFDLDDLTGLACGANYRRDGEWIDVAAQFDATAYRSWRGHRLSECRYTLIEGNFGCGIETTLQKSASTQHYSEPKLILISSEEIFITSASSFETNSQDQASWSLLRSREGKQAVLFR